MHSKYFAWVLILSVSSHSHAAEDGEKWEQPSWGVGVIDIPDESSVDESGKLKWPTRKGALVVWVLKGSPAEKAGISSLDIIFSVKGERIDSALQLRTLIPKLGFDPLTVSVQRPSEAKGRIRFRRKGIKLEPMKFRQLVESQIERVDDEVTGLSLYRHKESPKTINEESSIDLSIAGTDPPLLQMRLTYVADDWLFIEGYAFLIDGKRYTLTPSDDVEGDHDRRIWEWHTESVDAKDKGSDVMKIARALSEASAAKVFCIGNQYRKERTITPEEQSRIAMVLAFLDSRP
jgi:hypothetical protein